MLVCFISAAKQTKKKCYVRGFFMDPGHLKKYFWCNTDLPIAVIILYTFFCNPDVALEKSSIVYIFL